jgi:MFS family permease
MDVARTIASASMRPYQWFIVFICMVCNMIDGFDFFSMGFVLPYLPEGFASSVEKGYLISAGLIGMAVGAMFLAPLADRYGRRTVTLVGLTLDIISTVATALSPNASLMMAGRFLTGIGIGAIATVIIVAAQEFSSTSQRNLAIGFATIGFPLGSTLAGLTGVSLISVFGGAWQAMFWVAAGLSSAGLVLVLTALPESLSYLLNTDRADAADRIERITRRLGYREDIGVEVGQQKVPASGARRWSGLFGASLRERTLLLWIGYGFLVSGFYFVTTWTPQLIADASDSPQRGALAGTIISVGSIVGSIVFGLLGLKLRATSIAWTSLVLAVVSMCSFSLTMGGSIGLVFATLLGLAGFVAFSSYTAMAPPMYPPLLRARGYGSMVGVSRIGATVTPIIAGYARDFYSPASIFLAASILLAIGALAAMRLSRLNGIGDAMSVTSTLTKPAAAGRS